MESKEYFELLKKIERIKENILSIKKDRNMAIEMLKGECRACKYSEKKNKKKCGNCIHNSFLDSWKKESDNWEWFGENFDWTQIQS